MGTHPIFESDFDCLTECNRCRKHFQLLNWERLKHCPCKQLDQYILRQIYHGDVVITMASARNSSEQLQENDHGEGLAAVCHKSSGIAMALTTARASTRRRENELECFNKSLI